MTRNKAHDAASYAFQSGEQILLDANVLLYLQPPISQTPPGYARQYTSALKSLLAAGAHPVIEALVLSEYLNRYLRLEFDVSWKPKYQKFKDFRCSSDFPSVAKDAVADARYILKRVTLGDTPLTRVDLGSILSETEAGSMDLNDGVLLETCRLFGWKLLTNDSDMTVGGIDVLTTNPKLLAACP